MALMLEGARLVKLRQTPEDFLVTELGGPEPVIGSAMEDCEHRLYLLEKRGHDSIALLARLSRHFNVARRSIGLAGLKDRHAITIQKVTLPADKGTDLPLEVGDVVGDSSEGLTGEGWRLTLLGGAQQKLRSGNHSGNRFDIVVRDLAHVVVQGLPRRLEQACVHGWPNWFDSQRFGSAVGNHLPGAYVVEGEFEAAMKLHLTERNKADRSDKRRDKKRLSVAWPEVADMEVEHKPFRKPLKAVGRGVDKGVEGEDLWHQAYMALPYDIRGLWLSAWQSKEWNELLSETLQKEFPANLLHSVKIGVGGPLLFPNAPSGKRGTAKKHLIEDILKTLTTLPESIQMPHSELDLSKVDQHLSDHERPTMIHSDIDASEPERDELNGSARHKRWKTRLSFELPPGAYATVLVKRLFN